MSSRFIPPSSNDSQPSSSGSSGERASLTCIWERHSAEALQLIRAVEKRFSTQLKDCWHFDPTSVFKNRGLLARAEAAALDGLFGYYIDRRLPAAYFGILAEVNALNRLTTSPPARAAAPGPWTLKRQLSSFSDQAQHEDHRFFLPAEQHLTTLQKLCESLDEILKTPRGQPIDRHVAVARGKKGAEESHGWEDLLRAEFMKVIDALSPAHKYSSIKSLFDDNLEAFVHAQDRCKSMWAEITVRRGLPERKGPGLTPEGLLKKLRKWSRDTEFSVRLEKICVRRSPRSQRRSDLRQRRTNEPVRGS